MAEVSVEEHDEVEVTGQLVPTREFDRVKRSVCLLMPGDKTTSDTGDSWKASGFYVHIQLEKKKGSKKWLDDIFCIMTNHHVFRMAEHSSKKMVAIFDHEGTGQGSFKVSLESFKIFASNKDLDYALIRLKKNTMSSSGIAPIEADGVYSPGINDNVYIIQHPRGQEKHFSTDRIKRIVPPFVEYFADTKSGSSGSPVFVANNSQFVLLALHCKGVISNGTQSWNKGVLICEIINHLKTGKYTVASPGITGQLESASESKNPEKPVSDEDIKSLAVFVLRIWKPLGRELGLADHILDEVELNNRDNVYEQCYQMFLKWKRTKVNLANYGTLANALRHPAINREDLVLKFC